jgi:hypothetical protein
MLRRLAKWLTWQWSRISYTALPYDTTACVRRWRRRAPATFSQQIDTFDDIIRRNFPYLPPADDHPPERVDDLVPSWSPCRLNDSPHWCFINSRPRWCHMNSTGMLKRRPPDEKADTQ